MLSCGAAHACRYAHLGPEDVSRGVHDVFGDWQRCRRCCCLCFFWCEEPNLIVLRLRLLREPYQMPCLQASSLCCTSGEIINHVRNLLRPGSASCRRPTNRGDEVYSWNNPRLNTRAKKQRKTARGISPNCIGPRITLKPLNLNQHLAGSTLVQKGLSASAEATLSRRLSIPKPSGNSGPSIQGRCPNQRPGNVKVSSRALGQWC